MVLGNDFVNFDFSPLTLRRKNHRLHKCENNFANSRPILPVKPLTMRTSAERHLLSRIRVKSDGPSSNHRAAHSQKLAIPLSRPSRRSLAPRQITRDLKLFSKWRGPSMAEKTIPNSSCCCCVALLNIII